MAASGVRYNIGVAFKDPIHLEGEMAPHGHADHKPASVAAGALPQPAELVNRW
jgi:hypothetical protein